MKTRIKLTKILALAVAAAMLAVIVGIWGGKTAQAIIIVNSKTGLFTLAQGEAVRFHVVNVGGEVAIIDDGKVFDSDGTTLAEFPERRLAPGQATSFVYEPPPDDGQPMAVRAEFKVVSDSSRRGQVFFIPTLEVFDTATGKTSFGQDFIIDDGD